MSSEMLRKYIDIINEQETLNEEILEEGMLQKLAGLALGTVLALGPKIGQADTVYSYLPADGIAMKSTLSAERVPTDAKVVFAIDTDTKEVTMVKGGAKGQEVQPDPQAVKQGQQGQAQVAAQSQTTEPSGVKSVENQNQTALIFTGYSVDEIKDIMIEKIQTQYPDAEIDDKGRTLTSTRYSVQMKDFGGMFMTALMKGSTGTMDVITRYNFSKQGDKIKVIPFQQYKFTNAFGQPEYTDGDAKRLVNAWYKELHDTSNR